MDDDARLFNCARCQQQVLICSNCDHGNIYCGPACSKAARAQSLKEARQRYQQSRKGKFRHADQQRRYRKRQKIKIKIVMDHASPLPHVHDVLLRSDEIAAPVLIGACHFCGRLCSSLWRIGFLRRHVRKIKFHRVDPGLLVKQ